MITIEIKLHIKDTKNILRNETTSVKFKISTESNGYIDSDDLLDEINKKSILLLQSKLDLHPDKIFFLEEMAELIRTNDLYNTTVTGPEGWEDSLIFELTSENNNPYKNISAEDMYSSEYF
jgi:hypothetical protein